VGRVGHERRALSRRVPSRVACLVVGAALLAAACGAGATPSPGPASPTPAPLPETSFTGGTGSARLTLPARAAWDGGYCARGTDDAWLALNIGLPNGTEYFGLVVGRSPYTPAASRVAAKGGTFGGDDAVVTWRHGGAAAKMDRGGLVVELARNLSGGSFNGRLADGTEVRGTFSC
jgi:hypothetical protein